MSDTGMTLEIRRYRENLGRHQHDHHQLVLPVFGRLSLDIEGQAGEASKRKLALIGAGSDHEFYAEGENCFVVADIHAALAPELERLPAFIELDSALSQYVRFLYQQLTQDARCAGSVSQMTLLLVQLLKQRFGDDIRLDHRIENARQYLDRHFDSALTMREVARAASLSQRQLTELFRQQLGMTPQQYLTEVRMQKAWQLLSESNGQVQHVAEQVGYSSLAAFSDRFKRHFGRSPRYFRQNGK